MSSRSNWEFEAAIPWSSDSFRHVLQFYLFESPSPHTSVRGRSFATLGWEGRQGLAALRKAVRQSASESLVYEPYRPRSGATEILDGIGILDVVDLSAEYAVFFDNRSHEMDALYAHIRNAFAHGRFSVREHDDDTVYVLEDSDEKVITARLILKESTLLNWAQIVRATPAGLAAPPVAPE